MLIIPVIRSFGVAWAVLAIINAALFIGIVLLMIKGRQWREAIGKPSFEDK